MRMHGIKDLELALERKQRLYDDAENNPVLQATLQAEIKKIYTQLKLWDAIYNTVGEKRPTFV